MSLKNLTNSVFAITAILPGLVFTSQAQAQFQASAQASAQGYAGLAGSGYYGGTQQCPYPVKTGTGAVDMSDKEKSERATLKKLKADYAKKESAVEKAQDKLDAIKEKLSKHFSSDIVEFLTSVHIENAKECTEYATHPVNRSCQSGVPSAVVPAATASPADVAKGNGGQATASAEITQAKGSNCGKLIDREIPKSLRSSWITADGGGYCIGDTAGNAGSVNPSICDDRDLKPSSVGANKYRAASSSSECKKAVVDYRKTRIELGNAADRVAYLEAKIEEQEEKIETTSEKFRARKSVEADCDDCGVMAGRSGGTPEVKRDWWGIGANVAGALIFGNVGRKYDQARMEYQAQMGYVPDQGYPTGISLAYPFIQGAAYGALYGGTGQGGFGCAGGVHGTGGTYGANGGLNGVGNNAYGPFANGAGGVGGAFGYPNSMYGNVLGGGAYNPGINPYGYMNGPGSLNGSAGLALCFTWPCPQQGGTNTGLLGTGPFGNQAGLGGQFGLGNNGLGNGLGGPFGGQAGLNGMYGNNGLTGGPFGNQYGLGNNQFGLNGQLGLNGNLGNSQYQMQLMQQQQQMLQQQQQQQAQLAQYYQMQAQAQQQQLVRQQQVQQQAVQVQQEISSLQQRLQMLYSSAYSGGGTSLYGATGLGSAYGGISGSFNLGTGAYNTPGTGTNYLPTTINGTTTRGR